MHNILRHIVLATGDENLRASNTVRTIGLGLGLGAHHAKVGAGMGFG